MPPEFEPNRIICILCGNPISRGPCSVMVEGYIVSDGKVPEGDGATFTLRPVHPRCAK